MFTHTEITACHGSAGMPNLDPASLLERLKAELEPNLLSHGLAQAGLSVPVRLSENDILRRSLHHARKTLVYARRNGQVRDFDREMAAGIDLNRLHIDHFVIQGYDKYEPFRLVRPTSYGAQDQTRVRREANSLIAVLTDGVSSAPFSRFGSTLISQLAVEAVSRQLDEKPATLLDPQFLGSIHARISLHILQLAQDLRIPPLLMCDLCLASTLQIAVVTPRETLIFGLADGYLKIESKWKNVQDVWGRADALRCHNIPPLISSALTGESHLIEQRSAVLSSTRAAIRRSIAATNITNISFLTANGINQAGALSRSGASRLSRAVAENAALMEKYFEESLAFHIYRYQSSVETYESGITMTSDGLDYTSLNPQWNQRDVAFPFEALTDTRLNDSRLDLMNLWNIAAENPQESINRNGIARIERVQELLKLYVRGSHDAFDNTIDQAIRNSNSSYATVLDLMTVGEALEYCCLELFQTPVLTEDLARLSASLKRESIRTLQKHLPFMDAIENRRMVPLADDFSLVQIQGP